MEFSEKLVKLRKIKGITQDEMASAVGVTRQAVYKWESGQSYPEVPKLWELHLLFGISTDDLLDNSYAVVVPEKKRRRKKNADAVTEAVVQHETDADKASNSNAQMNATISAPALKADANLDEAFPEVPKVTAAKTAPKAAAPKTVTAPKVAQSTAPKAAPIAPKAVAVPKAEAPKAEAPKAEEKTEEKKTLFGRLFGKR